MSAGETKSIAMPHPNAARAICVWDHEGDVYTINMESNYSCSGDGHAHTVPSPANGTCATHNVHGDLGDNPDDPLDPEGFHDVEVCTSSSGDSITISGLRHTTVVLMDVFPEETNTEPADVRGGCTTTQPVSFFGIFFLLFFYNRKKSRES